MSVRFSFFSPFLDHLALPSDALNGQQATAVTSGSMEMSPLIPKPKESVITLDYASFTNMTFGDHHFNHYQDQNSRLSIKLSCLSQGGTLQTSKLSLNREWGQSSEETHLLKCLLHDCRSDCDKTRLRVSLDKNLSSRKNWLNRKLWRIQESLNRELTVLLSPVQITKVFKF